MRRRPSTIDELMTPSPICIGPEQSLAEAHLLMRCHGVRHLPVVGHGRVFGVVSPDMHHRKTTVEDVMTTALTTIHPDEPAVRASDSLRRAIDLLLEHTIGCVPVLGDDDQLVGIVTEPIFCASRASRSATEPRRQP